MPKIYKTYSPKTFWGDIFPHEETIELIHNLKIEPTKLTHTWTKKINGETPSEVILYSTELTLETLKSSPRFDDQTYFTYSTNLINNPIIGGDYEEAHSVVGAQILSIFDRTSTNKTNFLFGPSFYNKDWNYPLRIFIPAASGDFTDFTYQLLGVQDQETDTTVSNITNTFTINDPYTIENTTKRTSELIAGITATSTGNSNVGDVISVNITCQNTSVEHVYLEPVVGIIDRTEVKLTAGVGKFNILTSTLEAGDIIKVKIGHKKWSNVTTFTKTLGA